MGKCVYTLPVAVKIAWAFDAMLMIRVRLASLLHTSRSTGYIIFDIHSGQIHSLIREGENRFTFPGLMQYSCVVEEGI